MSKKQLTQKVQDMNSFKHLMVPVDFSTCSLYAVDFALKISEGTKTVVHLVHIIEFDLNWMGADADIDEYDIYEEENSISSQLGDTVSKAKSMMNELKSKFDKQNVDAHVKILFGDPIGEVLAFEKENDINLIIMGSHGSRGFNEVLIGSVAQKINRMASCPIFTVKQDPNDFKFNSLVYCSDFKEENVNKNLTKVRDIAEHYNAKLTLLFVNTPNKFEETIQTLSRIKSVAEKAGIKEYITDIFNAHWIEEGIVDYAEINRPNVVAITIHGYKGVKRIFNNNITESLVNHISVPLLTLNLKD